MTSEMVPSELTGTLGAVLIGSVFAVFLFGIVTLQVHMYYMTFREDKWYLKVVVALIWLLEFAHTFCVMTEIYRATILHYGQPDKLYPFPYLGAGTPLSGSIAVLVHTFFSARVWYMLSSPWRNIGVVCFVVAVVRFAGSIVIGVEAVRATVLEHYRRDWGWLAISLLGVGALIDLTIAVTVVLYFVRQREKVFKRTATIVDRLIQYTVCTGLLTSLTAASVLVAYFSAPDLMIWIALHGILSKVYSNSLLAALNGRKSLRLLTPGARTPSEERDGTVTHGSSARTHTSSRPSKTFRVGGYSESGNHYPAISVEMKTTTTVHAMSDRDFDGKIPPYEKENERNVNIEV